MPKRVEVWLKQPNKKIDAFYDYAVPQKFSQQVAPGIRVVVPFANSSRVFEGFITAVKWESDFEDKLREIVAVIDPEPVLTTAQIRLCDWIRRYYCSMFYEALAPFTMPVRVIQKRSEGSDESEQPRFMAYAPKRKIQKKQNPESTIHHPQLSHSAETLMLDYCRYRDRTVDDHRPVYFAVQESNLRFEIYCALAASAATAGNQSLILLPETGLVSLYLVAFEKWFGDRGAIYTGDLTPAARYYTWDGVRSGRIRVVLGSRSALFLPYQKLGQIMIDSPWDQSYSSLVMPRYETLRTVRAYGHITGAEVICGGSVIPVGLMAEIRGSKMKLFSLTGKRIFPLQIIDMKSELRQGNRSFLSGALASALDQAFKLGKKSLLMLNRSGQAGGAFCRGCGHHVVCSDCGVTMVLRQTGQLTCTCCGATQPLPEYCPQCGSHAFRPSGIGTAQAEVLLKERFPQARILRIDGESVDNLSEMAQKVAKREWDMIIGTRMLLKGFHFGSVEVVGALLMDGSLNGGGYAAAEEAFLLYKQFFDYGERAFGQTYQKDHPVVQALAQRDESLFYDEELSYRKLFGYPPAGHLVVLSVMNPSVDQAVSDGEVLYHDLKMAVEKNLTTEDRFKMMGPSAPVVQSGGGRCVVQILLRLSRLEPFHTGIWALIDSGGIEKCPSKVAIEVDPKASV